MKKIAVLIICALSLYVAKAQYPCAVFYSELGERFTLYIDGQAQHQYPESNVKVLDIYGLPHNVRIVFENGFIDEINKSVELANGTESSFMIHKRQGRYDMSPKNQIPLSQASRTATANSQAVVTFRGANVTTTTTTTTSGYKDDSGGNASIGINMGADGGNISVNISVADNTGKGNSNSQVGKADQGKGNSNVQVGKADQGKADQNVSVSSSVSGTKGNTGGTTTTTVIKADAGSGQNVASGTKSNTGGKGVKLVGTNITSSVGHNINPGTNTNVAPVVPGYNGRINCQNPMTNESFLKAKESVQSKSFTAAQLAIAKQVADANCLLVSQVKEIIKIFDFEESKLEFAKYAYKHSCDIDNYYQVNDSFEFEGSVKKLDEYLKSLK